VLGGECFARISRFCEKRVVAPLRLLLAAFEVVLHAWSGETDLVVGIVYANRRHVELRNMLGCFVNDLPIRTKLHSARTVDDLVSELMTFNVSRALREDNPYSNIADGLRAKTRANRPPVFNVTFHFQDFPAIGRPQPVCVPALTLPRELRMKRDLQMVVVPHSDAYEVKLRYLPELFDRTTIEALVAFYAATLSRMMDEPSLCIGDVALPPALREQVARSRAFTGQR
jgi:non-ribosomal peptide synthetase component F